MAMCVYMQLYMCVYIAVGKGKMGCLDVGDLFEYEQRQESRDGGRLCELQGQCV